MGDGAGDDAKGRLKKAGGEITGDDSLKREGEVDKASGKVKDAVGGSVRQGQGRRRQGLAAGRAAPWRRGPAAIRGAGSAAPAGGGSPPARGRR